MIRGGVRVGARLLAALLLLFGADAASAQIVTGRIVEAETRDGIQNAFVELLDLEGERLTGVFTNGSGGFRIQVPPHDGPIVLAAGAIGFATGRWAVPEVALNSTADLGELELEIAPVSLDPLDVEVQRTSGLTPGREWVRRRQLLGRGKFFSGAMIAALEPPSLAVLLSENTEFWISYDFRGIPSLDNPKADCTLVFVNEWPLNAGMAASASGPRVGVAPAYRSPFGTALESQLMGYESLDAIPLERIAAIEVYETMRDVPPGRLQFTSVDDAVNNSSGAHPCAVINVWTWDSW